MFFFVQLVTECIKELRLILIVGSQDVVSFFKALGVSAVIG